MTSDDAISQYRSLIVRINMTSEAKGGAIPAYLAGLGWSTIFGLSFLTTKGALASFSPCELLFLRFALATAALGLLAACGLGRLSFRGKPKPILGLVCLFQPIIYFSCETFGLRETATSTAGLILGVLPAAVAALSALMLKERLSRRQAAGLAVSVAGVVLIVFARVSNEGGDSPRGIVLMLCALASAAFYNVLSRRASSLYSAAELTFAMMASGAAFFGALTLGQDLAGRGFSAFSAAPASAWAMVAYLGILSSVLAFFLVNLSLARLRASQASVFGTVTTLVSLAAGIAFRGEGLGILAACGAAAIVAGVWETNKGASHA
jgi:drug/metabolite transporter (DMT)-like permease